MPRLDTGYLVQHSLQKARSQDEGSHLQHWVNPTAWSMLERSKKGLLAGGAALLFEMCQCLLMHPHLQLVPLSAAAAAAVVVVVVVVELPSHHQE